MQKLEDGLNGLTMQDEQYTCHCGHKLIKTTEEKSVELDAKMGLLSHLRKSYVCTHEKYNHLIDICQISGCKFPRKWVFHDRIDLQSDYILFHILNQHYYMKTYGGQDGVYAYIFIEGRHYSVRLNMSCVLSVVPQYFGLTCEISLNEVVRKLFSDVSEECLDVRRIFIVDYGDDNFNTIINILANELEYSCVLCGDYCGRLPPVDVYIQHLREAHGR